MNKSGILKRNNEEINKESDGGDIDEENIDFSQEISCINNEENSENSEIFLLESLINLQKEFYMKEIQVFFERKSSLEAQIKRNLKKYMTKTMFYERKSNEIMQKNDYLKRLSADYQVKMMKIEGKNAELTIKNFYLKKEKENSDVYKEKIMYLMKEKQEFFEGILKEKNKFIEKLTEELKDSKEIILDLKNENERL